MSTFLRHISDFCKKVWQFIVNLFKVLKFALFDKTKYKTIDEAINGYSFDYGYLYNLELAKLNEMVEYFSKYGISADNDKYIMQMKLAIKLLKIIINEDGYHFEYYTDNEGNDYSSDKIYVCDVEVNVKNADRFIKNKEEKDFLVNKFPHELYLLKAKHLYHKLREYFEQTWWD